MKDVNILTNAGVNVQASLDLLGDMEMYNETLSDFLDMVDEKKSKLDNFLANNDMPNYAIEVHALKSDVRYLGFLELGDLAYDSELKSKAGDTAGVSANHPIIMEKLQNMINVASTYLGKNVGGVQNQTSIPSMNQQMNVQPQPVMPNQYNPNMMPQPQMYNMDVQVPPQPQVMQQVQQQNPITNTYNPNVMVQPQMYNQGIPSGQPIIPQQQYYNPQPQTEAIYDLSTGTIQQQPINNSQIQYTQPVMPQQPLDPMSQALYNQQQMYNQGIQSSLAPKEGTILVVDDSNLVANFVKKIFDSKYEVVIANDGAKAIELCADDTFRSKIKACLLDLNMPNVNGYQVLEDFYTKGYFVKMPIAVISGVEDTESIDKVNKYPIIDILAKPFNERDVQRVVEKCLAAYF